MLNKKQINKITNRLILSLKRGGFLKKLKPLEEETLEEDIYELIEKWKRHLIIK